MSKTQDSQKKDVKFPTVILPNSLLLSRMGKHYKSIAVLHQILIHYNRQADMFSPSQFVLKLMQEHGNFTYPTYRKSLEMLLKDRILYSDGKGIYRLNWNLIKIEWK